MPCIRIKEAYHSAKHVIDGIELNCRVGELKEKTAEKTNIPAEQQSEFVIYLLFTSFSSIKVHEFFFTMCYLITSI